LVTGPITFRVGYTGVLTVISETLVHSAEQVVTAFPMMA
jgi:hypothetical protein